MTVSNLNRYGNWYETYVAKNILEKKYYHEGEDFEAFLERQASIFPEEYHEAVKKLIRDGDFLPAGRTLYAAGCKGKFKATTSNCYILPSPEDNIESIYETAKEMGRIFSMGGGCGINISKLRPNGAKVNNSAKTSTGAVSFMGIFDKTGEIIGANNRRAALMIGMECTHPDIEEFLAAKQDNTSAQSANCSILFTDEFMNAVEQKKPFELKYTVEATGEVIAKTIDAYEFFVKFCESQWAFAEPGAIFKDTVDKNHLLAHYPKEKYYIPISNPCAEYFGSDYNACNLGSINLYNFVLDPFTSNARIDYDRLYKVAGDCTVLLDMILDYGYDLQPLDANREAIDKYRAIGLGVMGLADMFIALGIKYGSPSSLHHAEHIMATIADAAKWASYVRGNELGTFSEDDGSVQLRNASLISIAPTGSLATMLGMSSGMESHYKLDYVRTTHALESKKVYFRVVAKSVNDYYASKGQEMPDVETIKKELPYAVEAEDIPFLSRIDVQAVMQKHVDNAISSTVILSEHATAKDVFDIYMYAWKQGCKGVTIYRENSGRSNILGESNQTQANQERPLNSVVPVKMKDIDEEGDLAVDQFLFSTACTKARVFVRYLDDYIFDLMAVPTGGCQSNIGSVTRLISLCIRSGVKVDEIIKELIENPCPACTVLRQQGKDVAISCGHGFADVLKRAGEPPQIKQESSFGKCPECHENTLRPEGKCVTCNNCGYNRCD